MTKAELIEKMAADGRVSKAEAGRLLDSFISNVTSALGKGDSVTLVGFGTFTVSQRAARKGRNPQTGDTINIPAAKIPRFRPGKGLKDKVK